MVLPYVRDLNTPGAPLAERRIAAALANPSALEGLQALRAELGAPKALRDYRFDETKIPDAVQTILPSVPDSNPVPVTADNLDRLLRQAWKGTDPQ